MAASLLVEVVRTCVKASSIDDHKKGIVLAQLSFAIQNGLTIFSICVQYALETETKGLHKDGKKSVCFIFCLLRLENSLLWPLSWLDRSIHNALVDDAADHDEAVRKMTNRQVGKSDKLVV
jgi:hypothetical protein